MTDRFKGLGQKILEGATKYPRVERIRERLLLMDYERDNDRDALRNAYNTAANANLHEDQPRTDEEIAFDDMMVDMGVPLDGTLDMQCRLDFIKLCLDGRPTLRSY